MKKLQTLLLPNYIENHPIHKLFSFNIMPFLEIHQFKQGEFMIQEMSKPAYLYYVIDGRAKIYMTQENGKVMLINFIGEGAFIGELELLQNTFFSKGVQTSTDLLCFAIPVHAIYEQVRTDAHFLRLLCAYLSHKASMHSSRFALGLSFPLENRLAEFILLSSNDGVYLEKHTEVCEFLGVTYRHLLFVLAQFVEDGLLVKEGRKYRIHDCQQLSKLATTTQRLDFTLLDLLDIEQ